MKAFLLSLALAAGLAATTYVAVGEAVPDRPPAPAPVNPAAPTRPCARCNARGWVWGVIRPRTCPVCHGRGVVPCKREHGD